MQGELGVNSLIFTITQRTTRVIDADRCTLYLVDNVQRGLFAMQVRTFRFKFRFRFRFTEVFLFLLVVFCFIWSGASDSSGVLQS